ncbi:hypothetical protein I7I48_01902 [Histoplasma ohiense]|nr:hypothetical protein I7I48_01902 [Histoplasma ohiense (nom. inval.)]
MSRPYAVDKKHPYVNRDRKNLYKTLRPPPNCSFLLVPRPTAKQSILSLTISSLQYLTLIHIALPPRPKTTSKSPNTLSTLSASIIPPLQSLQSPAKQVTTPQRHPKCSSNFSSPLLLSSAPSSAPSLSHPTGVKTVPRSSSARMAAATVTPSRSVARTPTPAKTSPSSRD